MDDEDAMLQLALVTYRRRVYRKGSANSVGFLIILVCVFFILVLPAGLFPDISHVLPLVLLIGLLAAGLAVSLLIWQGMREKQRLQALQLADVDSMSGRDFEEYVAQMLRSQGYKIRLTKVSGDYGGDIVAWKDGVVSILQVKRYTSVLGVAAIQQAVTAKAYYHASVALVVTNSYFTAQARQLAKVNGCVLIDRDHFAAWIVNFQRVQR